MAPVPDAALFPVPDYPALSDAAPDLGAGP